MPAVDNVRPQWNTNESSEQKIIQSTKSLEPRDATITLYPMEIKTFFITMSMNT